MSAVKIMSFFEYMMHYLEEDTPEGDLARDMNQDTNFPRSNNKNEILSYLHAKRACIECLDTFEECYKLYKLYEKSDKTCRKDKFHARLIAEAPVMYDLLGKAWDALPDDHPLRYEIDACLCHVEGSLVPGEEDE